MKKYILLLIVFGYSFSSFASNKCCSARLTAKLVQDILDNINLIRPKLCNILNIVEIINSKIDNITVTATCSGIDELSQQLSQVEITLLSAIDNITVTATCSGIDGLSSQIEVLDSKIGDLNMDGSCLDSQIDVPEDINNLNLTVIQLLKTILLELRGCSC